MIRNKIKDIILSISPCDELERQHIYESVNWVEGPEEIFRIQKPDIPPKHLVSYFVMIDIQVRKVLLMDHINAELWLPGGGHVEIDEHPQDTVKREIMEELQFSAEFINELPFFITQTITVGKTAGHTDVTLWYLLSGDSKKEINYDPAEFNGYKWFGYDEITENPAIGFDPHMKRFIDKLLFSGHV